MDNIIENTLPSEEPASGDVTIAENKNFNDPHARDLAMQKFVAAVKGLEDVIDYETGMLEQHKNPDFSDINARKARGMRILNQTMADLANNIDDATRAEAEMLLSGLKAKLERNSEVLKIHLEAVGELADMFQSAAEAQETDGTYNPFSLNSGRF